MKFLLVIIFSLFSLTFNAQIMSKWHSNDKIESGGYQLIRKSNISYYISNDRDNIYLYLKFTDRETQERILNEGLTVWISMDNKPVQKLGVRYPIGALNKVTKNKQDTTSGRGDPVSLANTIELIGFINEEERHFRSDNYDNFRGNIKFDNQGSLLYMMTMPIAKLPFRNSRTGYGTMPFSFGLEPGNSPSVKHKSEVIFWINQINLATSG